MAREIERKFLVRGGAWRDDVVESVHIRQGYVAGGDAASVRVRISGGRAWLNLKSKTVGVSRAEFDFEIPAADGEAILETLCAQPVIEKTRHMVDYGSRRWEVDEFEGENAGLVVAEIELVSEDESFEKPPWAGREVSEDVRYYNSELARRPYREWRGEG